MTPSLARPQLIVLAALASLVSVGAGMPASAAGSIQKISNIRYHLAPGFNPRRLSLDVYRPETALLEPVLIYFHGGGWFTGSKDEKAVAQMADYFAGNGYVFVAANYRLWPNVRHPTLVMDVAKAIGWVYRSIAAYGGNARKLYLMGHSAGAHLASLALVDRRYLAAEGVDPRSVRGVIGIDCFSYDLTQPRAPGDNPRSQKAKERLRGLFGPGEANLREASPITYVRGGAYLPNFLLIHAGRGSLSHRQALAMAARLGDVGRSSETYLAKTRNHASVKERLGSTGDHVAARILRFLSRN